MVYDNESRVFKLAKDNFASPTLEQRIRFDSFMNRIGKELLGPIWAELDEACPGYGELNEIDKMNALIRLNALHIFEGDSLPIDFRIGEVGFRLNFYSGKHFGEIVKSPGDGLKYWRPYIIPRIAGAEPWQSMQYVLEHRRDEFNSLSIPYRLLAISQHIEENVLTWPGDSWRFCARLDERLHLERRTMAFRQNSLGEIVGYRIEIADAFLHDEMMESIAQAGRDIYWDVVGSKLINPITGEKVDSVGHKQRKWTQESTDFLVYFLEGYLPNELGLYCPPLAKELGIKRSSPNYCSWDEAKAKYDLLADSLADAGEPQRYSSLESFKEAYRRARERREKLAQPTTPLQPGRGNSQTDSGN